MAQLGLLSLYVIVCLYAVRRSTEHRRHDEHSLMERVVVNVGLELGVIPGQVFTMLVLMAIVSTIMTAPGLRAWLPSIGHAIPAGRDA